MENALDMMLKNTYLHRKTARLKMHRKPIKRKNTKPKSNYKLFYIDFLCIRNDNVVFYNNK